MDSDGILARLEKEKTNQLNNVQHSQRELEHLQKARIRLETLKAKLTAMDPDSLDDGDFASLAEELQELQELHGSAGDAESAEGDAASSNALPIGDADGEHVLEWRNAARVLMELNPSAEQLAAISSSTTSGAPTDDPFVIALARRLLEERAEVSPGGDDVSEEESTEGSSEEEEGSESDSAESTEEYGALVERLKASQSELAALQAQAQALDERNARQAPPAYGYVSLDDGETQSETTDDGKYDRSAEGSEEESTDMESAEAAFGLSLHDDDAHGIEDAVENSYVELESLRAAVDFAEQEGLPVRDRQIFLRRFFDHFNSSPSPGAGDGRSSSPNASDAGYSLMGDLSSVGSTPMKTEDRKKAYSAQVGGPQGGGRGGTHAASPGDAATLSEDDISASASHDSATGPGGRGGAAPVSDMDSKLIQHQLSRLLETTPESSGVLLLLLTQMVNMNNDGHLDVLAFAQSLQNQGSGASVSSQAPFSMPQPHPTALRQLHQRQQQPFSASEARVPAAMLMSQPPREHSASSHPSTAAQVPIDDDPAMPVNNFFIHNSIALESPNKAPADGRTASSETESHSDSTAVSLGRLEDEYDRRMFSGMSDHRIQSDENMMAGMIASAPGNSQMYSDEDDESSGAFDSDLDSREAARYMQATQAQQQLEVLKERYGLGGGGGDGGGSSASSEGEGVTGSQTDSYDEDEIDQLGVEMKEEILANELIVSQLKEEISKLTEVAPSGAAIFSLEDLMRLTSFTLELITSKTPVDLQLRDSIRERILSYTGTPVSKSGPRMIAALTNVLYDEMIFHRVLHQVDATYLQDIRDVQLHGNKTHQDTTHVVEELKTRRVDELQKLHSERVKRLQERSSSATESSSEGSAAPHQSRGSGRQESSDSSSGEVLQGWDAQAQQLDSDDSNSVTLETNPEAPEDYDRESAPNGDRPHPLSPRLQQSFDQMKSRFQQRFDEFAVRVGANSDDLPGEQGGDTRRDHPVLSRGRQEVRQPQHQSQGGGNVVEEEELEITIDDLPKATLNMPGGVDRATAANSGGASPFFQNVLVNSDSNEKLWNQFVSEQGRSSMHSSLMTALPGDADLVGGGDGNLDPSAFFSSNVPQDSGADGIDTRVTNHLWSAFQREVSDSQNDSLHLHQQNADVADDAQSCSSQSTQEDDAAAPQSGLSAAALRKQRKNKAQKARRKAKKETC